MKSKTPVSIFVCILFLLLENGAHATKKQASISAGGKKRMSGKNEDKADVVEDSNVRNWGDQANVDPMPSFQKKRAYGEDEDNGKKLDRARHNDDENSERNAFGYYRNDEQLKRDDFANPVKPKRIGQRAVATPKPKPDHASKYVVDWFPEIRAFALGASSDLQLKIRHAPLPDSGSPWPLPQIYRPMDVVFHLGNDFRMLAIGETCDILEFYMKRIYVNVFGDDLARNANGPGPAEERRESYQSVTLHTITHLNVTVLKECNEYPSFGMDESYDLEIKRTGASLIAREVWGALRGLETFSQLVYQSPDGWYLVNKTFIHDFPRFRHRGILLDTSRHYLRKEVLLQNLEAMAMNKMNVFHWHIVDDQSFPYQSHVFPNLSRFGAFNPKTHIYTHKDIKEIIEYARLRGIRVIPEFDTPGHTYSWGLGQNYLLTPCFDYRHRPSGNFGPVNPILKSTYRFMETLFTEVLGLFPDKFMHVGGDEVSHECWLMNPHIASFMRRNNISDVRDLAALYNRKIMEIVADIGLQRQQGASSIVWQEVFDSGTKMPRDAMVQVWMGDALDVERVMRAGQRVIFSSCWYLDYINYGMDWDKYYLCEQLTQQMGAYGIRNLTNLVGGEACLWAEFADNDDIMTRLWPRASAVAERLWSSEFVTNIIEASPRIEAMRCRMLRLSLPVGALNGPGWCEGDRRNARPLADSEDTDVADKSYQWPNQAPVFLQHSADQAHRVYVVNLNAMYVLPLLILICIVGAIIIMSLQDHTNGNGRHGSSKLTLRLPRNIRGLVLVFFIFAICWCIWTSPMWMNVWETKRM